MELWVVEKLAGQGVLTHYCAQARADASVEQLRQDIGGSYVRCSLCGEKFLPPSEPGNPRLLLRLLPVIAEGTSGEAGLLVHG